MLNAAGSVIRNLRRNGMTPITPGRLIGCGASAERNWRRIEESIRRDEQELAEGERRAVDNGQQ